MTAVAYVNGEFVSADQAMVPVYDMGFLLGATVAEQLRTFGGKLFRFEDHLRRLEHSLSIVKVEPEITMAELERAARELVDRNHKLQPADDDLGLTIFVTPGTYSTMAMAAGVRRGPLVCAHSFPLAFQSWYRFYGEGQKLVVTDVRQVPSDCWPPELKCRSRMHYFLADKKAAEIAPGARALMLDHDGFVLEGSTANLVVYRRNEGLVGPPKDKILPGISVMVLAELAGELDIPFRNRDLTVEDVVSADEVMLCSTSPCVWFVSHVNGSMIGDGTAGAICRKLQSAWSRRVGLDIVVQANEIAKRRMTS